MSNKNLNNFLTEKHSILAPYLQECWLEYCNNYSQLDPTIAQPMRHFSDFLSSGKLIRGIVLLLSSRLFHLDEKSMLPLAAAMECIQSFLLIHDDIIDQSKRRRDMPSAHYYYQLLLESDEHADNKDDAAHYGVSQAICLGDILMLCALHLVSNTDIDAPAINKLTKLITQEIMHVGVAQMMDINYSHHRPTLEELYTMYRYKTARYTFSLPLIIPAIIAKKDRERAVLSTFGEALGILFQIKDDIMDFSVQNTGKSKGIDLVSGKHTLVRAALEFCEHPAAKHYNAALSEPAELAYEQIYEACQSGTVAEYLNKNITELSSACELALQELASHGMDVKLFYELLEYSKERER